jgi:hypothetical protein
MPHAPQSPSLQARSPQAPSPRTPSLQAPSRRVLLQSAATGDWDAFDGEASGWALLGGVGSVEERRIPARDFNGPRLLDLERRVWSDSRVNAGSGALDDAGLTGGFVDGDRIFESRDIVDGTPMIRRGVRDRIDFGESRRSRSGDDGKTRDGKTWDVRWTMDRRRA